MRHAFGSSLLLAVPLLTIAALPAATRPLERELPRDRAACWQRDYDTDHLASHPRQKVASVRLVHLPQDWPATGRGNESFFVMLYFNLRQRTTGHEFDYQLSGFCKPAGKGVRCVPEWEAGSWRIEAGPGGALDIRNAGITANPHPYDAEEIADGAVAIPAKPDDGIWRLKPASDACKVL